MKKSKDLNEADKVKLEVDKVINAFYQMIRSGNSFSPLLPLSECFKTSVSSIELGILGKDIYLIDIDVPLNKEKYPMRYGNLYKKSDFGFSEVHVINNVEVKLVKINSNIFRIGGMSIGFKNNDYCELIHYEHVSTKNSACLGNHCIIDTKGQIVFEADSPIKYPYYHKGCIVKYGDLYINLKTGLPIVSGYHSIESENYLFVECSSYKNEFPKGVYKIEYMTGNFEVIN
jgi:hypothetical protein